METRQSIEVDSAFTECTRKLSGDLELAGVYQHLDNGRGYIQPELTEYFQERGTRIKAGENVWMARNMASSEGRVFDFFSGGRVAGSLAINFATNQMLAVSEHGETYGDTMYHGENLVEAIDSIEGQLAVTA